MQSPTVLKAIYSLEHGQSMERLAQTLQQLGVAPDEVTELSREVSGGVGANWMTMAERIASERKARGQTVVAPELLRAANAMSAKRDTVRIHIQPRVNIPPPSPQHGLPGPALTATRPIPLVSPGSPVPTASVDQHIPFSSTPGNPGATMPARRITALVVPGRYTPRFGGAAPWKAMPGGSPGPDGTTMPVGGTRSALCAELEEAARLLALNPGLEGSALSPTEIQTLRECLRALRSAGTQNLVGSSLEPAGIDSALSEQKPISLRGGPVKF